MKGRILYLDILKVIALIFMALIHAFGICYGFDLLSYNTNIDNLTTWISIIYLVTPTIFMFAMGCGLYLTKNNTPGKFAKRGLKLLLHGFILNVIRGFLFYLILGIINKSTSEILEGWYWLWGSDILYFAGLFFLLYALLRKLKLKDSYILLISLTMFIVSNFILNISVDNYTLDMLLGNFIYLDESSYFPLLTWSFIPMIGYFFQKYYALSKNKNKYIIKTMIVSGIVLLISLIGMKFTNSFNPRYLLWGEGDFLIDYPTLILTISINIVYIGIIYFISKLIKNKKIIHLIMNISSNINRIYVIHWVLLMYTALIWMNLTNLTVGIIGVHLFGILVFIISIYLAYLFNKKDLK